MKIAEYDPEVERQRTKFHCLQCGEKCHTMYCEKCAGSTERLCNVSDDDS